MPPNCYFPHNKGPPSESLNDAWKFRLLSTVQMWRPWFEGKDLKPLPRVGCRKWEMFKQFVAVLNWSVFFASSQTDDPDIYQYSCSMHETLQNFYPLQVSTSPSLSILAWNWRSEVPAWWVLSSDLLLLCSTYDSASPEWYTVVAGQCFAMFLLRCFVG